MNVLEGSMTAHLREMMSLRMRISLLNFIYVFCEFYVFGRCGCGR